MAGRLWRKGCRTNVAKLNRARGILGIKTETETIHRALDLVVDEAALAKALRALVVKGHGHIDALPRS